MKIPRCTTEAIINSEGRSTDRKSAAITSRQIEPALSHLLILNSTAWSKEWNWQGYVLQTRAGMRSSLEFLIDIAENTSQFLENLLLFSKAKVTNSRVCINMEATAGRCSIPRIICFWARHASRDKKLICLAHLYISWLWVFYLLFITEPETVFVLIWCVVDTL